jgi:multiple sugar transport system permease protein
MTTTAQTLVSVKQEARVKKKSLRRRNLVGYLFISPWLFSFFAFTLIPIVISLGLAFTDYHILRHNLQDLPAWIGLRNFARMFFEDARYWKSVRATFYFALTSVPLKLAFALAVAMILNTNHRLVSVYRAAYYAPSIVGGSVAVAVMWRQIFGSEGLLNALLALVGLPADIVWLGDTRFAIWTLILLSIWQFGSSMLIFLAGLKQIPTELYESASMDGAGPVAKFTRITLPMLTPVILFNLVMQMIFGLTVFTSAFIITGGAPLDTTLFYALYVYQRGLVLYQMGYAAAMAWIMLAIIAGITALVFKSSPYWVHYQAEKGI